MFQNLVLTVSCLFNMKGNGTVCNNKAIIEIR